MKKNVYINNLLRMNIMIKNNNNENIKTTYKKSLKRNNSSQRYLEMYQNEKLINKNQLTPDVNKKSIKKTNILFYDQNTLKNKYTCLLGEKEEKMSNNLNLLSNSFDISTSFSNIEEYMNLYFNSGKKNPLFNKENEIFQNNIIINNIKEKIIAKYEYKNKKWVLIEVLDNKDKIKSKNIYWKEYSENIEENNKNGNNDNNGIKNDFQDFNVLEEKYNSLKLEYNKMKQLYYDLNNKYEQINIKNKEIKTQLNYYMLKIKEIEKDKEKYIKSNKKLKEEINKIPFLIEQEMNKFREEAGKKISKKIYDLEQENKILKRERYKSKERTIFNE